MANRDSQNSKNRYQEIRQLWKEAFPEKSKRLCETETIAWWIENKHDKPSTEKKINELNLKKMARGLSIIKAFSKSGSTPASTPRSSEEPVPVSQCQEESNVVNTEVEDSGSHEEIAMPPPRKKHAQDAVNKELQTVESRMLVLVNAKDSGLLLSLAQKDELKKLKEKRPHLQKQLKRLGQIQAAAIRHRQKSKANPLNATSQVSENTRKVGRPSLNREQPGLLDTILRLISQHCTADERRRCESLRAVKTLDDLLGELRMAGFNISRSGLYLRLLPRDSTTIEGKRHVNTVPVKLIRAQNTMRKSHPDSHFAAATVKFLKDLAVLLGDKCVFVVSQDDKARVPLGLPAAQKQSPILMRMDYRVQLPDHDWVVATKHKLIPSVYAGLVIQKNVVSYSGPTYIAIRSGKHDSSTAFHHAVDLRKLIELTIFQHLSKSPSGDVKPIIMLFVDGGPDENPRFPKTLKYAACQFVKYDLDAIFIAAHAPHQSASNPVERRMAPLSRDLCGIILPHDTYGSHLDGNGKTINAELEQKNFEQAGKILAEIWCQRVIDNFPVVAEYQCKVGGADTNGTDSTSVDTNKGPDDDLNFEDTPEFLTERWKYDHVRQSQYLLQIVKCGNPRCCGPSKTNVREILQNQFIPNPVMFKKTEHGVRKADKADHEGHYGNLTTRLCLKFLELDSLPFDAYCPSVEAKLSERTCKYCNCYHTSKVATKAHEKIHRETNQDFQVVEDEEEAEIMNVEAIVEEDGIFMIDDLQQWLQPIFEDEAVASQYQ